MNTYQLYCFGQSGNSYKAALMLELCGIPWTQILVDYFNGETRGPTYRAQVNEMGEVPVLVDGDLKLSQSGVILTYLSEKTGKFGGETDADRREILRWILFDNHKFTSYAATLRFLVAIAKTGDAAVVEFLRGRVSAAFAIVEAHLAKSDFLVRRQPTIADFSLCGYLFYPEEYGVPWSEYPNICRWRDRIAALPRWKAPYDLMERAPAKRD
jgi:glutathione S-transferase